LGHFRQDCPQLRKRTRPSSSLNSRTRDRPLLAMTELEAGHASSDTWGGSLHSQTGTSPRGRTLRSCQMQNPTHQRAKGAPLRPVSVSGAGGNLEGMHTRRSRGKPSRTRDPGAFLTSTSS
ncbi:hypothetical protein T4E_6288, partial [Trichinella pseudospiralis]